MNKNKRHKLFEYDDIGQVLLSIVTEDDDSASLTITCYPPELTVTVRLAGFKEGYDGAAAELERMDKDGAREEVLSLGYFDAL